MARINPKLAIAGSLLLGTVAVSRALRSKRNARRVAASEPLIGELCRVRTRKVTKRRGGADFHDGQGGRKIKVRSSTKMAEGDMARIVAFHPGRNVYEIEPV